MRKHSLFVLAAKAAEKFFLKNGVWECFCTPLVAGYVNGFVFVVNCYGVDVVVADSL